MTELQQDIDDILKDYTERIIDRCIKHYKTLDVQLTKTLQRIAPPNITQPNHIHKHATNEMEAKDYLATEFH